MSGFHLVTPEKMKSEVGRELARHCLALADAYEGLRRAVPNISDAELRQTLGKATENSGVSSLLLQMAVLAIDCKQAEHESLCALRDSVRAGAFADVAAASPETHS